MGKLLLIGFILLMLVFLIARKFSKFKFENNTTLISRQRYVDLNIPTFIIQQIFKKTLLTVGTGFIILLIVLVVASKFKIILILLPISFYLIGQYFVLTNHLKVLKNQKATFDLSNNTLTVNTSKNTVKTIHFANDRFKVKEVKSVQKNNGLLMGYFELSSNEGKYYFPFLLSENPQTKPFFDKLLQYQREVETKVFPII